MKLKPSDKDVQLWKSLEEDNTEVEIIPRVIGGLTEYQHWDGYEDEEREGYRNSWEEMESNGIYMRDFL